MAAPGEGKIMKITQLFEAQTKSNIATSEEIATLIININRGFKLRELKAVNDKIYFVFECPEVNTVMVESEVEQDV